MEEYWLEMLFPVVGMNRKATEKWPKILKENSFVKFRGLDYRENGRPINKCGSQGKTPIFGESLTARVDRPRSIISYAKLHSTEPTQMDQDH